MKKLKFLAWMVAAASFLLCSCESTRVYEKTTTQLFQDKDLQSEEVAVLKDGVVLSKDTKSFVTAKSDGLDVEAYIETSTKNSSDTMNVVLKKEGVYLAEKNFKTSNGEVSEIGKSSGEKNPADYGDFIYIEGNDKIGDFFVAKTEVTQDEYVEIIGANPSTNIGGEKPVESITIQEAIEYCNALSQKEKFTPAYKNTGTEWQLNKNADGYRLLTIEEMQFLARGGKDADQDANFSVKNDKSWHKGNSKGQIHAVATKKPDELGLYDIIGNVSEWCFSEGAYAACGGGYSQKPKDIVNSKLILGLEPNKYLDVGFRVCRTVTEKDKKMFVEKKDIIENIDKYLLNAAKLIASNPPSSVTDEDHGTVELLENNEKITVVSTPNGGYIFYSILGKPFVILGSTTWNLIKCLGYAFINFYGGYSTIMGDGFLWKMPDVAKAREKAADAKEGNRIKYYPEYHLPFTNNHIEVVSQKSEVSNAFSKVKEREVKVISTDTYTYDNTIAVKRSAAADANSTASVIGYVGTAVTVPVSAITWVGGAAFGVYAQIVQNK